MIRPLNLTNLPRRAALTLVEMLVVLVIIALLTAVLLPVFLKTRATARATVCQSNLHQIGMALELYATDHSGYYPSVVTAPHNCTWSYSLLSYVQNSALYSCPEADDPYLTGCPPSTTTDGVAYYHDGDYIINDPGHTGHFRRTAIHNADHLFFVFDGTNSAGFAYADSANTPPLTPDVLYNLGLRLRHNNGCNVLFADGHTKWCAPDNLADLSYWKP